MSGELRTYLGTAPGVGKTYAMLNEGWRRSEAGERVVVGWVERHGRPETRAQLHELEIVEHRLVEHGGKQFEELDLEAILRRTPDVVLVDELAHTNADGKRRRWEDVVDLLAAGCDVITTVNIANLFSIRDYAAMITGAGTVESVPDQVVRGGEVVLLDLEPEALRRRILAGLVYGAEAVGGALSHYFRATNLAALSALGRAWVDGTVAVVGDALLAEHGILDRQARRVIVAGVSSSGWAEPVIRRATALADEQDADLQVVHVAVADGLSHRRSDTLDRSLHLAEELGAAYLEVTAPTPAAGLAGAVRNARATSVVVARHRSRVNELVHGSVADRLRRLLPDVAVIEVGREEA